MNLSFITADETGGNRVGICGILLTWISWLLVIVTLPFSLCVCFKVIFFKSLLVSLFLSRQCIAAHQPFLLGVLHTPLDLYGLCT